MTEREGQLGLPAEPVQNLKLFPEHFLKERLPELPEYSRLDATDLMEEMSALWERERSGLPGANEAQTEEHLIQPALTALGFHHTVQAGLRTADGRRQPDYALFLSDEARRGAMELEGAARYGQAVAVADAKRFGRPLDVRQAGEADPESPVAQITRYISITKCPWGILTDGRIWRLYAAAGDLVEGACYEVDLIALLERGDSGEFRKFAAFFSAEAFRSGPDGRSFLDRVLAEGEARARGVGDALEQQVFAAVPRLAEGLLGKEARTAESLAAAFEHALVLLYRILFCLYAEARNLLPVDSEHYRDYSLRRTRLELAHDIDRGRRFSRQRDDLYNDLRALFRLVAAGDDDLGVNEYDGGLFAAGSHPYFEGRWISDYLLAPALDRLFRIGGEQVDYRELSVRHLGTIYERLLAYRLREGDGGELTLEASEGRRESGSYFTPEPIVDRIVETTLEPLLGERSAAIKETGLTGEDALEAFLALNVVDPAMGSGHFLVSATSYIATYIATDPSYGDTGTLDLSEIRRRVVERCLYGVDLNPMAVELAKLSLWLATARGDEPLTFLGNLRAGNSLVGADLEELLAGEESIFSARLLPAMPRRCSTGSARSPAVSARAVTTCGTSSDSRMPSRISAGRLRTTPTTRSPQPSPPSRRRCSTGTWSSRRSSWIGMGSRASMAASTP